MEYTFEKHGKIGVFKLKGTLIGEKDGLSITETFAEKLDNGFRQFVIDLEDLQHINSSGLGVFITLMTKSRKKEGGDLALAHPSSYIHNLLKITKLNTLFSIYPSLDEALGAYVV